MSSRARLAASHGPSAGDRRCSARRSPSAPRPAGCWSGGPRYRGWTRSSSRSSSPSRSRPSTSSCWPSWWTNRASGEHVGPAPLKFSGAGPRQDKTSPGIFFNERMDFRQQIGNPLNLIHKNDEAGIFDYFLFNLTPEKGGVLRVQKVLFIAQQIHGPRFRWENGTNECAFPRLARSE